MLFKEQLSIGLDIGNNSIKIAGIRKLKRPKIEFLRHIDFVLSGKVKRLEDLTDTVIVQTLRDIIKEIPFPVRRVHSTLSTAESEVRTVDMPLISNDEIKPALHWNLSSVIVTPIEDVEYDYFVLSQDKNTNTMKVMVGIASRKNLAKQLDILQRTKLKPLSIDIDSLAVYNAFISLHPFKDNQTVILINIGAEKSTIILRQPDHDPLIISHPIGGNTITHQIEAHLHISYKDAEEQKINRSILNTSNSMDLLPLSEGKWQEYFFQFAGGLNEIISQANIYYQVLNGVDSAEKILLTGGGSCLSGLDLFLAQKSRIPVMHWNPLESKQLNYQSKSSESGINGILFSTAIGLALRE